MSVDASETSIPDGAQDAADVLRQGYQALFISFAADQNLRIGQTQIGYLEG